MTWDEFVFRIALAVILGGLIGLERQMTGHVAGIRINILIAMGACLFMLLPAMYGSEERYRIASYIISGVGFLCSGVIFKDSGVVRGLNTAAILWCTAAIGVLASTGNALFSVMAAGILISSNLLLRPLMARIRQVASGEDNEKTYRVTVTCRDAGEGRIRSFFIGRRLSRTLCLTNLDSGDVIGGKTEIQADFLSAGGTKHTELEAMVTQILECPDVVQAGWKVL